MWFESHPVHSLYGPREAHGRPAPADQRTSFFADSTGIEPTSASTLSLTSRPNRRHACTVTRPCCRRHVPVSSPLTRSAPGQTDLGHSSDRKRGCGTIKARSADAKYGSPAGSRRTVSTASPRSKLERSVRRAHRVSPSTSTSISSFSRERNVCRASESTPRVEAPKDPAHPPDHQANSSGVDGPTDRRNRRASSRRAGSADSVGGSTSHQEVVAPSHSILTAPVNDAILNSRKFTPIVRREAECPAGASRARKARFAFSTAALTAAPKTGLRGNRPSVKTATSWAGTTYTAPLGPHTWTNRGSFQADGEMSLTRAWSANTADRGELSWSPANAASTSRPGGRRRWRCVARSRNASTFSRVIDWMAIVDAKRTAMGCVALRNPDFSQAWAAIEGK